MRAVRKIGRILLWVFGTLVALMVADDRFQFATHPDPAQPGQMIADPWFATTIRVLLGISCASALLALTSLLRGSNRSWSAWASTAVGVLIAVGLVLALKMPAPQ